VSASDEWTEWHLTPRGWERGSQRLDFSGVITVPPPADRVRTVIVRDTVSSMYSALEQSSDELWSHSDTDRVAELTRLYGPPPS
jgi:hypothetical protein